MLREHKDFVCKRYIYALTDIYVTSLIFIFPPYLDFFFVLTLAFVFKNAFGL
jgi:hypothetical protein